MTIIDLEFDTKATAGASLGDIAASLVSVDELLRDLATLASSGAEFREIQVAAMTMRSPMKVTLSLLAIPDEAVKAFEAICREIIVFRERRSVEASRSAIDAALDRCVGYARITGPEADRIHGHIAALQHAEVPLKAVAVRGTLQES